MAKKKKTGGRKRGTPGRHCGLDSRQRLPPPLDYMLRVMRDPGADPARRDGMAIAAAPSCRARVSDLRLGEKEAELAAARHAAGRAHGPQAPILRTHKDVWPGSVSRHPRTRGGVA